MSENINGNLNKKHFFQSIAYSWHDFCMCIDERINYFLTIKNKNEL